MTFGLLLRLQRAGYRLVETGRSLATEWGLFADGGVRQIVLGIRSDQLGVVVDPHEDDLERLRDEPDLACQGLAKDNESALLRALGVRCVTCGAGAYTLSDGDTPYCATHAGGRR